MGTGKRRERAINLPPSWWPRLEDLVHEKWVNGEFVDNNGRKKSYFDIYEFIGVTRRTISKSKKHPYEMRLKTFQTISREVGYKQYECLLERLKKLPEHMSTLAGQLQTNGTADIARPSATNSPETPLPAEIQAQLDKATALSDLDKFSDAIPILEGTIAIADRAGHAIARVKVRTRLGHALYESNEDYLGAERQFREALELVPAESPTLKHNVLHGLGDMLLFSGRLEEAKATIDASLDAAKESGDQAIRAESLISSAILNRALGFHDHAHALLDEAIGLLLKRALDVSGDETRHNAYRLAACYINKALLHRDAGNLHEALPPYEKAEEQYVAAGYKLDIGKTLLFRGELHCSNADWKEGFDCFSRALSHFEACENSMWCARALQHISRLYATHEEWEPALHAALTAVKEAEKSGQLDDQVDFLLLAASLLKELLVKQGRKRVVQSILSSTKDLPEDQRSDAISRLTQQQGDMNSAVESIVRNDNGVRDLLRRARAVCDESKLKKELADCKLRELYLLTSPQDKGRRREIRQEAIDHLKEALSDVHFPKRRAYLMGRIHSLYMDLREYGEARAWLERAGEVIRKTGDVFGLANYYGSLAEIHRACKRNDEEVAAYRKSLEIIEGRSFVHLLAGTQINLASALRFSRQFDEAQRLLANAETLCDKHNFKEFIPAIARNRDYIEKEQQASQAPDRTLPQLLRSLHELIQYRPDRAVDYLPFWYFAWNTQLLAVVRSGPHLSFMVVTDDVHRFMELAAMFTNLASHFLMATSEEPTVKIETGLLSIPPKWLFPKTFRFMGIRRRDPVVRSSEHVGRDDDGRDLPIIHFAGPATMMPVYTFVGSGAGKKGEGQIMALTAPKLPQQAIDLMIGEPITKLIRRRTIWFPTSRFDSNDPFLTDLRIAHERAVFPVYFDHLPTSDSVSVLGTVEVALPRQAFKSISSSTTEKWERAILKLTSLPKLEARAALFDLPEVFSAIRRVESGNDIRMEIYLLEFEEVGRSIFHPTLLVRDRK